MSISSDVTESGSPESPTPAESQGRTLGNRLARVVAWTVLGAVVFAVVVGAVIWRSLDSIPKVPVEVESARGRLNAVTGADLAEQQSIAADLEAQVLAAEAAADEVVVDPDFLETQRAALDDRNVDDIVIDFAKATPVPDAVYDSYLLIGSDLSESLADVIIYVLLPRDGSDPILTSLPRDLYLPNPCTRQNSRLNAALNGCGEFANGPELLGLMVEDYTGIPVDHFAIVNFEGFADV
ncbi:MAG TPA: LytR family transcriptional regulator, partial [Actinobacteria bacterium]|nr:LytR family transcriptional regulator [Actinomycetota bacterium]